MKCLLIIPVLLASAYGGTTSLDNRITGGIPIEITQAPYQVVILKQQSTDKFNLACAGSIITKTVILTTAHCVDGFAASQLKIRAGSTYYDSGGQVVGVLKYTKHANYNKFNFYNNIALIYLSEPIIFSESASPVNLPYPGQTVPEHALSVVSGWGSHNSGGLPRDRLYRATVPIVDQEKCVSIFNSVNPITGDMICAGWVGTGAQDACTGDGGAPLTIDRVLIGLASFGVGCGIPNYPGVYTRVPEFLHWINSNL